MNSNFMALIVALFVSFVACGDEETSTNPQPITATSENIFAEKRCQILCGTSTEAACDVSDKTIAFHSVYCTLSLTKNFVFNIFMSDRGKFVANLGKLTTALGPIKNLG